MLEFRDWKPCLDTLPFVSSLHMNVTNGRMKELHSTTWPNYQADIEQIGDYSTKCHIPEDVKKMYSPIRQYTLSHLTVYHMTALRQKYLLPLVAYKFIWQKQ